MWGKVFSAVLAMVVIFALSYWIHPSLQSSLTIAVAVGIVSVLNIIRTSRNTSKSGGIIWNYFGTSVTFWVIIFVIGLVANH